VPDEWRRVRAIFSRWAVRTCSPCRCCYHLSRMAPLDRRSPFTALFSPTRGGQSAAPALVEITSSAVSIVLKGQRAATRPPVETTAVRRRSILRDNCRRAEFVGHAGECRKGLDMHAGHNLVAAWGQNRARSCKERVVEAPEVGVTSFYFA